MPPLYSHTRPRLRFVNWLPAVMLVALTLYVLIPGALIAQSQPQSRPSPSPSPSPQQQENQQNTTPSAGGPEGDIGPIAIPKKKEPEPKKEEAPMPPKKAEPMPNFSLKVNVPLVTLDVGVLTKNGQFVPGLKEQNFRVLEDGVPQKISGFNQTQAPITAVILMEFSKNFYEFEYDSLYASSVFASTLKKEDWIALIAYDMREHIISDFTQDKREIYQGLRSLEFPMSAESNLFDALFDTVDRLEGVEGRKYIILISSGIDTFSKHTLDQTLKKVQNSKDIAIYSMSTGQALREYAESHGLTQYLCGMRMTINCEMDYAQADNQMKSFAKMTGGKYYAPLFTAQFREDFADIGQTIRNEYSLAYHPSNSAQDGSYRKIKVELVGPDGKPLKMRDEKGHDVKYTIVAREGYRAKREVE